MSRLRRWLLCISIAVVALALLTGATIWWFFDGPGSTAGLYEEYEPKYRPKVEMVGRLAAKVDAEPEVAADELRAGLNPPLYVGRNCELTNDWRVRQPARYPVGAPKVEILDLSRLTSNTWFYHVGDIRHSRWNGPPSFYVRESLEGGLAQVYLAVIRQREYHAELGTATMEAFVFDVRMEERVGRLTATIQAPPGQLLPGVPSYLRKQGETPQQAAERTWLGEEFEREFKIRLTEMSAARRE